MDQPRRPTLEVLVGIPGSGKTTYARRVQARRPGVRVVSPDDVRDALYPGYGEGRVHHAAIDQGRVFGRVYRAVARALDAGFDVLFDATNLTRGRRRRLVTLARRHGARPVARYFPIDPTEALRRNAARPRQVPPEAILAMAAELQPPTAEEGFDRVVVEESHEG